MKVINRIAFETICLIKPLIFILLFGEVGIRLYTERFDKIFWFSLGIGYVLLYFMSRNWYKNMIQEVRKR